MNDENASMEENNDKQMFEIVSQHIREPRAKSHLMTEADRCWQLTPHPLS